MIPRCVSWVIAFAEFRPIATSQTQTFRRVASGARKARRLPSGEIAALLIFGLSKKSLRRNPGNGGGRCHGKPSGRKKKECRVEASEIHK